MKIISPEEIRSVLPDIDVVKAMEEGFTLYAEGKVTVPPVGEMVFYDPPGDVHIKYGYIQGDDYYVIKIASGFYDNPKQQLSTVNGMMLIFNQKTGQPVALLQDEGLLTDIRTAAAGAVAARYFAPEKVERIGIMGTGVQARMQLSYLLSEVDCQDVLVWGRAEQSVARFAESISELPITLHTTVNSGEIAATCNLIVTTTPAKFPVLHQVRPGTHITAVGSDTAEKNEIASSILAEADLVVADSLLQCQQRGEIFQAMEVGAIDKEEVIELGRVIAGKVPKRTAAEQISIVDLTGVAVQDIMIAKAVYYAL